MDEFLTSQFVIVWRFYILIMLLLCLGLKGHAYYAGRVWMGSEERNLRRAVLLFLVAGVLGVGGRFLDALGTPQWLAGVLIIGGLVGLTLATLHLVIAHSRRE